MSQFKAKSRSRARKGKILVLIAICLPILIGMTALVFDIGISFSCARTVQSMADAAATVAAKEIQLGKTNEQASQACASYVQADNSFQSIWFEMRCPPTTGPNAGSSKHVEVDVRGYASTFFMQWLGNSDSRIIAGRAVAGFEPSTADAAIVVLDPDPPPFQVGGLPALPILPTLPAIVGGLELLGIGQVSVDGAVISNNEWGGEDENGDQIGTPSGLLGLSHSVSSTPAVSLSKLRCRDLRITGGVDHRENYGPYQNGQPHPLAAGRLPVTDPLASLPVPTISVDPTNVKDTTFGGKSILGLPLLSPPIVLKPGVYEWIEVLAGRVHLDPGVYIIRGRHPVTKFSLCLLAGQVEAEGVMFYITDSAGYTPGSGLPDALDLETAPPSVNVEELLPAAVINVGLLGSKFSGLNSGSSPFHGMLIYQRRHDRRPVLLVQENLIGAGEVQGTVYSKWGHVVLAGKGRCDARFVAGTMRIIALLDVQIRPTPLLSPAEDVYLVE
jgi:hypothetical protein